MTQQAKVFVFMHGYNQSGEDMKKLGQEIEQVAPKNSQFLYPNAPFKIPQKQGYSWFPYVLTDFPPEIQEQIFFQSMEEAIPYLMYYLGNNVDQKVFTFKDMVFIGFSQGASFALHSSMRLPKSICCAISFSGGLPNPNNRLKTDIVNKTKICLIHGKKDKILPYQLSENAFQDLKESDFDAQLFLIENGKHNITPESIEIAKNFLTKTL